jgi:hypothetical protein
MSFISLPKSSNALKIMKEETESVLRPIIHGVAEGVSFKTTVRGQKSEMPTGTSASKSVT